MAVLQEDISMCKILIERGADLTTQQNKNLTSVVPESIAEEFCSLVQGTYFLFHFFVSFLIYLLFLI